MSNTAIDTWNEAGNITESKVIVLPLQSANMIHQEMAARLKAAISRSAS